MKVNNESTWDEQSIIKLPKFQVSLSSPESTERCQKTVVIKQCSFRIYQKTTERNSWCLVHPWSYELKRPRKLLLLWMCALVLSVFVGVMHVLNEWFFEIFPKFIIPMIN